MLQTPPIEVPPALRRRLGLPLLVLYGTGITIGAGIYVLIGAVAGHAGGYAPWAFVLAAIVMAFTVASYAELSTRFPVSAGEAAYVKAAFNSRTLSISTGLLTIVIGVISSSAVTLGSAGYIAQFTELPQWIVVMTVVALLSAIAAWGILESVLLAGLFTVIEVGGLLAIIAAAVHMELPIAAALLQPPPLDPGILSGIGFASLLAFFAFIGFEDLANVVEEAKVPHRDIPRAMVLTLLISTILYVAIAVIAISAVSIDRLVVIVCAAQPCLPRSCRHQPGHDQRHRDCRNAKHDTRPNDHVGTRDLWHGAARRSASHRGPGTSADSDTALRDGNDRCLGDRAGAVRSVRVAGGRHIACDARGVRAGQFVTAAASPPPGALARAACQRSDLGSRRRSGNLPGHDRKRASEMINQPVLCLPRTSPTRVYVLVRPSLARVFG